MDLDSGIPLADLVFGRRVPPCCILSNSEWNHAARRSDGCHYRGVKTSTLEILENAELPAAQAHAMLKVLESEMSTAHDTLATKTDLLGLKAEVSRVLTCILGQTAVLAGLGYFVLAHLGR